MYFVIAYDRTRREIVERYDFPQEGTLPWSAEAWETLRRLVHKYRVPSPVEVVLLGSASEKSLRITHGRYFEPVSIIKD